ncbi:uncharacterized protein N7477_010152 [Penicillium maclennaniae]|uniref:uncharacterized protein n=1 Tax=Penicillium maclennaniae TaxID=1343394 RepID=UPI002542012B|nr:uncharacterized protein N7477_010152 [Penicillium maclennaniae]KAJ5662536.1 hypothetical protein N7477_010152 [Penicillium maclennaniae]
MSTASLRKTSPSSFALVHTRDHPTGISPDVEGTESMEMTTLLVKQYPPLFHAALDTLALERALAVMTNLRHLRLIGIVDAWQIMRSCRYI